jgi:hypothetical protein
MRSARMARGAKVATARQAAMTAYQRLGSMARRGFMAADCAAILIGGK